MGRKRGVVCLSAAAVTLALTATAWACTKQAVLIGLTPQSAPPFTEIIIKGQLQTVPSTVQIRWNAMGGPELGSVGPHNSDASGNFSVPVVVPDVGPGVYSVVVTGPDYGVARAAVQVVAPSVAGGGPRVSPTAASGDLWNGLASTSRELAAPELGGSSAAPSGAPTLGIALLGVGLAGFAAAGLGLAGRNPAFRRKA